MLLGGLSAAVVGIMLPGLPPWVLIPLCCLAAAVAGALAALCALLLKVIADVDEVISTLLLTLTFQAFGSLVVFRLMPQSSIYQGSTPPIAPNAVLPAIWQNHEWARRGHVNIATLLAVGAITVYYLHTHSQSRLVMKAVGTSPSAASLAGYSIRWVRFTAVVVAGALAGMGAVQDVLGVHGAFTTELTAGVGYTGILVALLLGDSAPGILVSALLFGLLQVKAIDFQALHQWPKEATITMQAVVIGVVLFFRRERNGQWTS
jgi:simple sugar transport system permease protein